MVHLKHGNTFSVFACLTTTDAVGDATFVPSISFSTSTGEDDEEGLEPPKRHHESRTRACDHAMRAPGRAHAMRAGAGRTHTMRAGHACGGAGETHAQPEIFGARMQ